VISITDTSKASEGPGRVGRGNVILRRCVGGRKASRKKRVFKGDSIKGIRCEVLKERKEEDAKCVRRETESRRGAPHRADEQGRKRSTKGDPVDGGDVK